jgi:hypothetical protein
MLLRLVRDPGKPSPGPAPFFGGTPGSLAEQTSNLNLSICNCAGARSERNSPWTAQNFVGINRQNA